MTTTADTLETIASNVATNFNNTAIGNLTASSSARVFTFHPSPGWKFNYRIDLYGPHDADRSARLQAFINGNKINMAGITTDPEGAYVNINLGGINPTFGVFAPLATGAIPPDNATAVAQAIQKAGFPDITATPTGTLVTITAPPKDPQEVECDVTTDVCVGQPTACFCSLWFAKTLADCKINRIASAVSPAFCYACQHVQQQQRREPVRESAVGCGAIAVYGSPDLIAQRRWRRPWHRREVHFESGYWSRIDARSNSHLSRSLGFQYAAALDIRFWFRERSVWHWMEPRYSPHHPQDRKRAASILRR